MKALLIQPPIYDTQYYAEWSMPSGLLKVSSWLRKIGYDIRLLDCLYPGKDGDVKHEIRGVVQVCSTLEWRLPDYREMSRERFGRSALEVPAHHRYKYEFGLSLARVEAHLTAQPEMDLFERETPWEPDEIWITSIMTYWWESTRDMILLMKRLYPDARVRVGGIYPTLAPQHLRNALAACGHDFELVRGRDLEIVTKRGQVQVANQDCIVTGEIPDASNADLDFEPYRQMTRALEGEETATEVCHPDNQPRLPVRLQLLRPESLQRGKSQGSISTCSRYIPRDTGQV